MFYEIVKNEQQLQDFIDWLPDLKPNEAFYVCLFARKKYCNDKNALKSDKSQLKRFTANKSNLYTKIRQLECKLGTYVIGGVEVPVESLALYISINPRNLELATKKSLVKFADLITTDYNGYNPHQEVLSQIQQAVGTKKYICIDFDGIDFDSIKDYVLNFINLDCLTVLKTRGGFHLLVELGKIHKNYKNNWYGAIVSIEGADVRGDMLSPIPGCVQGNFVPYFINV